MYSLTYVFVFPVLFRFALCKLHSVAEHTDPLWQSSFSFAEEIFREIKYLSKLATSIVNFCQKSVRLNFRDFHITAMHSCIFSLFQRLWDNMYNFILFVIADVVDYASRLLGQHNAKTFFRHENAFGVILITFRILFFTTWQLKFWPHSFSLKNS